MNTFYLHPTDVGLPKAPAAALRGGDAAENAGIVMRVLNGDRGPARDVVVLNAGTALFVAGESASIQDGIARAAQAVDRGDGRRTLERLVAVSSLDVAAEARP